MSRPEGAPASAALGPVGPVGERPPASEQLKTAARNGFLALVEIIPGAVGRGLLGAVKGFFLFGLAGAAIGAGGALLARLRWDLPVWMISLNAVVATVALALAGAYGMGLRSALTRLASEMEKRGVVRAIYALIRPALLKAARKAEEASRPLTQAELTRSIRESVGGRLRDSAAGVGAKSLLDRVVRFIAGQLQEQMVLGVVMQVATAEKPDSAVEELEHTGLGKVEEAVSKFIVELFEMQTMLAFGAALVASVLPIVVYVLLS